MLFDEAKRYLLSLGHETLTIKLGLKNSETLLGALENPQNLYPSVQIAGTNGKGSTAVFLDSICRAAGIYTGLFTSPHLVSITERIRIDGESIDENQFGRLTGIIKAAAEKLVTEDKLPALPTFFEHVTAIALLAFAEARVELAILETGLGGRLDSTTAARADIVAITSVAMDHEEYLGHTIEEISSEKAAIIRPGVTAVVGPQEERALDVLVRRCEEVRVTPRFIVNANSNSNFPTNRAGYVLNWRLIDATRDGRCRATFHSSHDNYEEVRLGLRGRHQMDNAAVAIALAEALRDRGFRITSPQIVEGLETATHAGRLELWPGKSPILFDGAHNSASTQALRNYLDEFGSQPITLIFGAMRDKRVQEMLGILLPKVHELILTALDNPRAASLEQLQKVAQAFLENSRIHLASSPQEALRRAREVTQSEGIILITGSLYLIGDAQRILKSGTASVAHDRTSH